MVFNLESLLHTGFLILHFPLQRYLLPQNLILDFQDVVLCFLDQFISFLCFAPFYVEHLVDQLLHFLPLSGYLFVYYFPVLGLLE